jgi:hypothetical protein
MFSVIGTNQLENNYLKRPPHIMCGDLMQEQNIDSNQQMVKYEFDIFKKYYIDESDLEERKLVERMANTGYLGCYC